MHKKRTGLFNWITRGLLAAVTIICGAFTADAAQFGLFRDGVRPAAMGGAFSAVADDTSAMAYNPAGLAQLIQNEFRFEHTRLFVGLDENTDISDTSINYAQPIGETASFGLNILVDNQDQIRQTSLGLTGAISVGRMNNIMLGASAKNLRRDLNEGNFQDVNSGDPVLKVDNASAFALDLGLLYLLNKDISLALVARNVNQPDLGLKEEDKEPATFRAGVAAKVMEGQAALDIEYRDEKLDGKNDLTVHAGYEKWVLDNSLALRGGINNDELGIGAGLRFKDVGLGIDYTYLWHFENIEGVSGTHMFGLIYKFGRIREFRESTLRTMQQGLLDMDSDSPWRHLALGNNYRAAGQNDDAVAEYKEAIRLDARFVEGYLALGQLYIRIGDIDRAREQYQQALLIDPDNNQVREILANLK